MINGMISRSSVLYLREQNANTPKVLVTPRRVLTNWKAISIMATSDSTTKRCSLCREYFPANSESFYRHPRGKYGLQPKCKTCQGLHKKTPEYKAYQKRYNREYRQRPETKERKRVLRLRPEDKIKTAAYRQRPDVKQKSREHTQRYHLSPQGKRYAREYAQKPHARKSRAIQRQQPEYKEYMRVYSQTRRTLKKSLPDTLTKKEWLLAIEYFSGCCAICGRQLNDLFGTHKISLDHWTPVSKGGGTTVHNVLPLCFGLGGCNNSKHDRDAHEWLQERFGKSEAKAIEKRIAAYFEWVKSLD